MFDVFSFFVCSKIDGLGVSNRTVSYARSSWHLPLLTVVKHRPPEPLKPQIQLFSKVRALALEVRPGCAPRPDADFWEKGTEQTPTPRTVTANGKDETLTYH